MEYGNILLAVFQILHEMFLFPDSVSHFINNYIWSDNLLVNQQTHVLQKSFHDIAAVADYQRFLSSRISLTISLGDVFT